MTVSAATSVQDLLAMRAKAVWRFFMTQDLAYWAMAAYLFVEYVRPQNLLPFLSGIPMGQITLGLALLAYMVSGRGLVLKSGASGLFLAFTGVILISSVLAFEPSASYDDLRTWISWVVIYFLIVNVVNTPQRMVLFIVEWLLCHYYMAQGGFKQFAIRGFKFASWGVTGAPGWFHNSGEFGIAMCMFAAVSWHFYVASRPYLTTWRKLFVLGMPATAVICVIGSSSRGAVIALAAMGFWELMRSKKRVRALAGLTLLSVAGWFILPAEQKARFMSAGEDRTSVHRLVYWKAGINMATQHPVLGIGYGNWVRYYSAFYAGDTEDKMVQVSHNIFIQCVAELGFAGLIGFCALIAATLVLNARTRRMLRAGRDPPHVFMTHLAYGFDGALISYLVAGFFVTVLYYPFFWINLALTVALNSIARQSVGMAGGRTAVRGQRMRGPAALVRRARPR